MGSCCKCACLPVKCIEILVQILNVLILALGITLIVMGVTGLNNEQVSLSQYSDSPIAFIVLGSASGIVALAGFLVLCTKNTCLATSYIVLALCVGIPVMVLGIIAMVVGYGSVDVSPDVRTTARKVGIVSVVLSGLTLLESIIGCVISCTSCCTPDYVK